MRQPTDTTLRYLKLLSKLPVYPQRLSTSALQQRLEQDNQEYRITPRTMQRDLEKLSGIFPIGCLQRGRRKYWFWMDKDALTQLPAMSESTALTLRLAETYLSTLMPPTSLALLKPYFKHARGVLQGTQLHAWTRKVRILPDSQSLLPATIGKSVQATVYDALLHNKKLTVMYQRRGEQAASERLLNPLGLVVRRHSIYLIATAWGYADRLGVCRPPALCPASHQPREGDG